MNEVLLSTIVEEEEAGSPGFRVHKFTLNGERYMQPIVDHVIEEYGHRHPAPDPALFAGQKVTLARHGESAFGAASIQASEGTVFMTERGPALPALLPKGKRSKGILLRNVLDIVPGYNNVDVLRQRVEDIRSEWPALTKLTRERLERVDRRKSVCDLAVFGKWFGGAGIWFIHSYHKADDIVEGYLAIEPSAGESEHGSVYGRDLLPNAAEIVGFTEITFRDAMNLDFEQARALVAQKVLT
jgi:hypothetical protein